MYRIVLTEFHNQLLFSYQDDLEPIELRLFKKNSLSVGTVVLGRVNQVVSNISASFLDIAKGQRGFLQDMNYKQGDCIPVQIVKEGTALKDPKLSTDISLSGNYCVVSMKKHSMRASAKLEPTRKKELLKEIKTQMAPNPYGIVLRTNAAYVSCEEVVEEINTLSDVLLRISEYAHTRTALSVLYRPREEWLLAILNTYRDKLDEVVTDSKECYDVLADYLSGQGKAHSENTFSLRLYEDKMLPLIKLYSLETRMKDALKKRVWLKCGGFLMIEPTEALTSIDVNSGKITQKTSKEETILAVNLEAADEIAAQLRLRNISGIIIIDFINMEDASHDSILLSHFREVLKKDPIKSQVHGMTSLGLVEMTRMKERGSLYEQARSVSNDAAVSGDEG